MSLQMMAHAPGTLGDPVMSLNSNNRRIQWGVGIKCPASTEPNQKLASHLAETWKRGVENEPGKVGMENNHLNENLL